MVLVGLDSLIDRKPRRDQDDRQKLSKISFIGGPQSAYTYIVTYITCADFSVEALILQSTTF